MKSFLKVVVILALVLAAMPAVARDSGVLLAAIERGDAGTVALEISLGADLPAGLSVPSGVLPEAMRLMPLTVVGSVSTAIAQQPALTLERYLSPRFVEALYVPPASMALPTVAEAQFDTPLMAAARCGKCDALISLLMAGADPEELNVASGQCACDIAAAAGNGAAQSILVAFESYPEAMFTR